MSYYNGFISKLYAGQTKIYSVGTMPPYTAPTYTNAAVQKAKNLMSSPLTNGFIHDFYPNAPRNSMFGYDWDRHNLTLGINLAGTGPDGNILIVNNSATAKEIDITNHSPNGTNTITADHIAVIANTDFGISIDGSTGANGAVLTSNGSGLCSWVGGVAALDKAANIKFEELEARIRALESQLSGIQIVETKK